MPTQTSAELCLQVLQFHSTPARVRYLPAMIGSVLPDHHVFPASYAAYS